MNNTHIDETKHMTTAAFMHGDKVAFQLMMECHECVNLVRLV